MTRRTAPQQRRFLLATLAALPTLAMTRTAHAAKIFPFIPDHYDFSTKQVQEAVARKFPIQRTVSQIAEIALSNPVVGMSPDRNRVTVHVDARMATPFIPNPVNGAFTLSTQLGYDAQSGSVVLVSPSVDDSQFTGDAAPYNQQIAAGGAVLAAQLLDRYPIYTFKPEELQFSGVSYEPGTITILTKCIRVQIVEK